MSIYSNPASGAAEVAQAYISAVLELLDEKDPIDVLSTTPQWCCDYVEKLSSTRRLHTPEKEGKWSVATTLQHLADSELVWGYRIRRVLSEDHPRLDGYDQDAWASRLGYADADPGLALATFKTLRQANLSVIGSATDEDLERGSIHEERGHESVRHMIRLQAGHDILHRRQVERIVATVGRNALDEERQGIANDAR